VRQPIPIGEDERSALQAQIDAIDWYHEFDFGNGLRAASGTPDIRAHRVVWDFIRRHLDAIDFAGKSVLDIGCWDGYWSIYAEARGARSVLASDDLTQNWSSGEGIHLAKRLLGSSIEIDQHVSIYELTRLGRTFDVILCLGVYYHLFDPFAAFAEIRHCCHDGTIVVLEGDATAGLRPDTLYWDAKTPSHPLFLPTPQVLAQMLQASYFQVIKQEWRAPPRRVPPHRQWLRRLRHRLGGAAVDRGLPDVCERMIVVCTPFDGENPLHVYKPPFGLHRYDSRFR
jgi:tRNA (mo5U34)-methyltransferase